MQAQTIIDLGRKVKAKYPGEYDDLPDADVGSKVKAKFPGEYDDFTDVAAGPVQPQGSLDNRSGGQVAFDQAKAVGSGIVGAVTGIPGAVAGIGSIAYDSLTGNATGAVKKTRDLIGGAVKGTAQPFVTAAQGVGALAGVAEAPTDEAWQQAAEGAGGMLASAVLPKVAAGTARATGSVFNKIKGAPVSPVTTIEEFIAPSGKKAKVSTIRNAPKLSEIEPKLATVKTPAEFDQVLMDTFKKAESGVDAAESAIPRTAVIDSELIADKIGDLIDDYAGNERAVAQLTKEWGRWAGKGQVPWEDFLQIKRNVGANLNSGAMRRAYGALMEASGNLSPELKAANRVYSTVRRGIDDAGIDLKTGRRILATGKHIPGTFERIKGAARKAAIPIIGTGIAAKFGMDLLKD